MPWVLAIASPNRISKIEFQEVWLKVGGDRHGHYTISQLVN